MSVVDFIKSIELFAISVEKFTLEINKLNVNAVTPSIDIDSVQETQLIGSKKRHQWYVIKQDTYKSLTCSVCDNFKKQGSKSKCHLYPMCSDNYYILLPYEKCTHCDIKRLRRDNRYIYVKSVVGAGHFETITKDQYNELNGF